MNRIHWTDAEQKQVAAATYNLLAPRKLNEVLGQELLRAVRTAQTGLPETRRRALKSTWNLSSFLPFLERTFDEYASTKSTALFPELVVEPKVQSEQSVEEGELADRIIERLLTNPPSAMLDKFADLVASKLMAALSAALAPKDMQTLVTTQAVKHNPEPTVQVKKPRMIVGVIGLLNDQCKIISSQFGNVAFKHYSEFPNGKAPAVHYMIGMVGFMNHPSDGKAKKLYGNRYYRLSNGMTSLTDKVRALQAKFDKEIEDGLLPVAK